MRCALLLVTLLPVCAAQAADDEIAFTSNGSVWIVNVQTRARRLVTDLPGYDRPLAWSPDGMSLLFWKHSDVGWDLWRIGPDGSGPRNLTNTTSGGCRSCWK